MTHPTYSRNSRETICRVFKMTFCLGPMCTSRQWRSQMVFISSDLVAVHHQLSMQRAAKPPSHAGTHILTKRWVTSTRTSLWSGKKPGTLRTMMAHLLSWSWWLTKDHVTVQPRITCIILKSKIHTRLALMLSTTSCSITKTGFFVTFMGTHMTVITITTCGSPMIHCQSLILEVWVRENSVS